MPVVILLATVILSVSFSALAADENDFVRWMNLGKAHLENRDAPKAIEALNKALRIEPASAPALRNLGRAYFLAKQYGDVRTVLEKTLTTEADSAATHYLLGLARLRLERPADAVGAFEQAVRLDPHTAAVRYQLAGAYQAAARPDKAQEQLLETVRLDPLHASAQFKLSTYAREKGDLEEFRRRQNEFLRLRKIFGDETRSVEALEQCVHAYPEPAPRKPGERQPRPPGIEVKFQDAGSEICPPGTTCTATTMTTVDIDKSGRPTILVTEPDGKVVLRTLTAAGTLDRTETGLDLPAHFLVMCAITGDFHNDVPKEAPYDPAVHALADVFLMGPSGAVLLKQTQRGKFTNVTEAASLSGLNGRAARWMDYEHDGDLDLVIAREKGLELWQNNGDGRFQNVTQTVGIPDTSGCWDAAAADLDADVAIDLVVARGNQPTRVFQNRRAGRFSAQAEPPGPWPAAKHVLADDLDNDGQIDVILVSDGNTVIQWGRSRPPMRIEFAGMTVNTVSFVDYDNDGRLDLCVAGAATEQPGRGIIRLWRNVSEPDGARVEWPEVTEATGLKGWSGPSVWQLLAADGDADGDTDLWVVTGNEELRLLRNNGGHANGQLKLRLATVKTNPSGIGVHVELRRGAFWVTRNVTSLPIEIGLAGHKTLDSVQTVWTNGVVDNLVDVAVGTAPVTITEKNVAAGSCPFLYVWDGSGFRFVTDLLGNSPVGLLLRRDVVLPADPDEIVEIGDASSVPPRKGAYRVQITSEFREVLYLDTAKLMAADHPPDWELHPTDKLIPPPFPPSELVALSGAKPLLSAAGDDGINRAEALRHIDGNFAPPGPPLPPPFRGMCHKMALTMDFGPLAPERPWVLALTGWLQYGDASTNIALSQSSDVVVLPPTLEAETPVGWRSIDVVVGIPAGKTKTIICDLTGRLPAGSRRLRLTTTFEIRWDRIALFERQDLPATSIHELLPATADLQWRGFSEIVSRRPGHPTTPDHAKVLDRPPWRTTLQGWCTRYGDVVDLVTRRDGRLALINGGDALTLDFRADALPPVPPGRKRTFFLYSFGWDKDGDHNVLEGDTVESLPKETGMISTEKSSEQTDWDREYNTRWVPASRFQEGP